MDATKKSSLQEAVILFQNVTEQYKKMNSHEAQLDTAAKKERREYIFQTAVAFEKFVLYYGHYHLNGSALQINITNSKLSLRIQRHFRQNTSEFHLEEPGRQASIKVPSINFDSNGSVIVGILYKDLHELFVTNPYNGDGTEKSRRLNNILMAATMYPKPKQLQQNVVLRFRNIKATAEKRHCVFWNGLSQTNPDGWSNEGCHVVTSKSNSEETECSCNHLTHFAVLFDYGDSSEIAETEEKILKIITYVGLALSIMGIILTVISYLLLSDVHQPLSQIRVSLAGSLGAGQIIFLAGINATGNTGACVTVAALMQYFLMAAFCWMLVEGIYLYLLVVQVYNIGNKMKIYHTLSWGFPAVMVAMSLSIAAAGKDGIQSFVSDEHCWISSANNLIWIFVAFVVMIEVINLLLLVRVIKEMTTMQSTGETNIQQIRLSIKACVLFLPLLGATWLFGLLSPLHKAFVYIFTILNSIQGFLIFLLHCVRNSQIRERFKRRVTAVFPAATDGKSAKKTSRVDQSDVDGVKIIEVQPSNASVIELK
ncbi:adhesion G protein-coupled receptor L4-like [Oculina patagonica]